jgi:L-threonylcarbamoyladenylate synthase
LQTIISSDLQQAIAYLQAGETVAIPTETVYGLAANALDEKAVLKIFEAKQRPFFDPLIVHIDSVERIEKYALEVPPLAKLLAEKFMPGPITLLLKKQAIIPDLVTSGLDTVGLRIPAHPIAQQLLKQLPFPLAAPSANPFGYISPTTAQHVFEQLQGRIPFIVDGGDCIVGVESTIVEVIDAKVIIHRLGGLSIEAIQEVCGNVELQLNQSSNPTAPGKLASHYAPKKPLIVGDVMLLAEKFSNKKKGIIAFKEYQNKFQDEVLLLSAKGNLHEAASNLFKALRHFDKSNCEIILAEYFPDEGLGRAINDRLKRAVSN